MFRGRAFAITLAHTWNWIGLVILIIWEVPEPAKWFALNTNYSAVAMSSVLDGWVNDNSEHSAKVSGLDRYEHGCAVHDCLDAIIGLQNSGGAVVPQMPLL